MKMIPLSQGQFAKVDDDDYEKLISFHWKAGFSKGMNSYYAYRRQGINGKRHRFEMHRVITNCPAGLVVDHKNHDTLDNRKENLRICTRSENMANSRKQRNTSSIYKGVCFNKLERKWVASIRFNRKRFHLGYFRNEIKAAIAYNEAALIHHGEFSVLNIIPSLTD